MGGMNVRVRHILQALLAVVVALGLCCCSPGLSADGTSSGSQGAAQTSVPAPSSETATPADDGQPRIEDGSLAATVREDGTYTSKDEVAYYLHTYGHLPSNYISKTKARKQGWDAQEGNLQEVCPGKSIGGGPFYNDDGQLPDAAGRSWRECDINYHGGYRGAERIVWSNDGLIYYTGDHYQHFERLY